MSVTQIADRTDAEAELDASATIFVCITCRLPGAAADSAPLGPALAAAAAHAAEPWGVTVRRVRCLANCERGLSAALRREGAWTYVFGHLDAARDGAALVQGALLLARSSDGLMPWRGRPSALKRGLIARVPPTDYEDPE